MASKALHSLTPGCFSSSPEAEETLSDDRLLVQFRISEFTRCLFGLNRPRPPLPRFPLQGRLSEALPAFPGPVSGTRLCVSTASGPFLYHGTFHCNCLEVHPPHYPVSYLCKIKFYIFETFINAVFFFFMAKLRITLILILAKSQ